MERNKHYWGYRIAKSHIDFFRKELEQGRLRQGWGWEEATNLNNNEPAGGKNRNRIIYNRVKKGDILVISRLPKWHLVTIAEATEDFDKGYKFKISELGDFGHIFPAKKIKAFARNNQFVEAGIRSTLRNRSRFWNINHLQQSIEKLLNIDEKELEGSISEEERTNSIIHEVFQEIFNEKIFSDKIFEQFDKNFSAAKWENLLVYGLEKLFPNYVIERAGGKKEVEHGTDILIKIPGIIPEFQYAIAIQVKDYQGSVNKGVKDQISKAEYWNTQDNLKLIDKIVIITGAEREDNKHLIEKEEAKSDREIKFIFAEELKDLLTSIAKRIATKNF